MASMIAATRQPRAAQGTPRAEGRRLTVGFAALGLAAFAGLRDFASGPSAPLAPAAESDVTFVMLSPGDLGLLSYAGARSNSPVARAAGYESKPGGRPTLDEDAPPVSEKKVKLRKGEETEDMQFDRVTALTTWLRSLKGKFVKIGPKPWETHRFSSVVIQVRLNSKQGANTKIMNQVTEELRRISGMHPKITLAKKNNVRLGWRKGAVCGAVVTLFGPRMHDLLERLNTIILPRVRDFEGLIPNSFDSRGNYWMRFWNQEPFKELDELIDSRELVHGFDLGINNNCFTQPDGLALMKSYGFPFNSETRPWRERKKKLRYIAPKKK